MQIKTKLFASSVLIVSSLLVMGLFSEYFVVKTNQFAQATEDLYDLEIGLLKMRKHEKNFIFSFKESYLKKFEAELVDFEDNFQGVMRFLKDEELEGYDIMTEVKEYGADFETLVADVVAVRKPEGLFVQFDNLFDRLMPNLSGNAAVQTLQFYDKVMQGVYQPSLVQSFAPENFLSLAVNWLKK